MSYAGFNRTTYARARRLFGIVKRLGPVSAQAVWEASVARDKARAVHARDAWSRAGVALVLRHMLAQGYLIQPKNGAPYKAAIEEYPPFAELHEAQKEKRKAARAERGLSVAQPIRSFRRRYELAAWLRV